MFTKLHLLSQDAPTRVGEHRWRPHPYLRMEGAVPRGPAVLDWSERQRKDLEAIWRDPSTEGARERLARDLATFCEKLGWVPQPGPLEDAERHGEEYLLTVSPVPSELYLLPWEILQVGATGAYLSDYASTLVRYAVPGLPARESLAAPAHPGVLFAWSSAGGAVPHEEQAAAIREAASAGGVSFEELPEVDEARLQAALERQPLSVLHLLCHGLPGPEGEPPLLKWGASDNPSEISATRLSRMLRRFQGSLRLVVLSACGSGDGQLSPLLMSSMAQEVHRKGISNVVAARYPLSIRGSQVMTRALYDPLLREAWSLERALRHARQALFRVDEEGRSYPGDAYGIQLYTHDTEKFVSDNDVEAERPVLASYPFGTSARPTPASTPPRKEVVLQLEGALPAGSDAERHLRRLAEDDSLRVEPDSGKGTTLRVNTTVDGAQRLLGVWRSRVLQTALGVIVGQVLVSKVILPGLAGASTAQLGKTVGTKASAQAGEAAVQQAVVATGKAAVAAASKAGLLMAKLAIMAVVGSSAAIAGGRALYHPGSESSAPRAVVESSPADAHPPDAVSPLLGGPSDDVASPSPAVATPGGTDAPRTQSPPEPQEVPPPTLEKVTARKPVTPRAASGGARPNGGPRPTLVNLDLPLRAGSPPRFYRSHDFGESASSNTVGFVVPPQPGATGPEKLVWSSVEPTKISVSARNASTGAMQELMLRGYRKTRCGSHPMNAAMDCAGGSQNALEVYLQEADNRNVPSGVYVGSFRVKAQGWHVKTFSAELVFDIKVTIDDLQRSQDGQPLASTDALRAFPSCGAQIQLKSWKGDYLQHTEQGVTSSGHGKGSVWTVECQDDTIRLKSWKGDYLRRPDAQEGVASSSDSSGTDWTVEYMDEGIQLKSWKGDYLSRFDTQRGVSTSEPGNGTVWTLESLP